MLDNDKFEPDFLSDPVLIIFSDNDLLLSMLVLCGAAELK